MRRIGLAASFAVVTCLLSACGEVLDPANAVAASPAATAAVAAPITPDAPIIETPTPTPSLTSTPQPTATPRSTPTPAPQITYPACDNVPAYLLRLDTQGRVAVEHRVVPSQPDGDGFACGDQLEHKRELIDLTAMMPTPTPTPSPSTVTPTPSQPTITPTARQPTLTPTVQPTPSPTARPDTPTPTPAPCPTVAEVAYLQEVRDGMAVFSATLDSLEQLSARVESDPSAFFTVDIRRAYATQHATIKVAAQAILDLALPSPARAPGLHGMSQSAARGMIFGLDELVGSFDDIDAGRIDRALDRLEQAEFLLDEAVFSVETVTTALAQFCE